MYRRLLYLLVIVALVSMACSFSVGTPTEPTATPEPTEAPTDIPEPTDTPEPTEEPTEEPTATSEPLPTMEVPTEDPVEETEEPVTEVFESEAFFIEEFDYGGDLWSYFLMSGEDRDLDLYTENGRLIVELNDEDVYSYITYDEYTYTDVGVEALFENRGVNTNNVSLVCRYSDEGWYEFNVGSDGLYNILRWDEREYEYSLLASGGSNAINMGKAANLYTITCEDDILSLWINGFFVKEVRDRSLREGQVGVSVASFNVYPVVVEFESVEIFVP
ncbi:MAG TPA: hypothetical protein VFF68_01675 [Anaerolineaceae bacterium]|nr:hypothetical protein [Anaerolineaceae bacterium]